MANLFDYLDWRGDLDFKQVAPNCVDALLFATLSYIHFGDAVPAEPDGFVTLREAARRFFAAKEPAEDRVRVKNDLELLEKAAASRRFGNTTVGFYRDILCTRQEIQFGAMTFRLSDGSAVLAFRGTDATLVGWKEDFNMSFQQTVPAQTAALEYTRAFAEANTMPMYLCGHSKGGNLAVYAGACCGEEIQRRIVGVYNHDGPGFWGDILKNPGYLAMVPRIHTFVPQSSVIGMLLEHEEPYSVVRSKQVGLLQHDPYTWTVLGGDFVRQEEITVDSRFFDKTLKKWLAENSMEERNAFVDAVYDIITSTGADTLKELFRPRNLAAVLRNLKADDKRKAIIARELAELVKMAAGAPQKDE